MHGDRVTIASNSKAMPPETALRDRSRGVPGRKGDVCNLLWGKESRVYRDP